MVHQLDAVPGRTCMIDGKSYLFFSGYDYLGMHGSSEFNQIIQEGLEKFGHLHPSSRISNTQLSLYKQLEQSLSSLTGTQDTVTFSSGYLAAHAISQKLSGYENVYKAPGTHPALSLAYNTIPSETFAEWSKAIVTIINPNYSEEAKVICFDAVNVFAPEVNDVSFLQHINPQQKLIVLIDDSHGIGITGVDGKGISSYVTSSANIQYIFTYSLSKAFNIIGGAVSCSTEIATALRNLPCYSASTAISPAMAYTFLHSKEIYASQLQKLKNNMNYFISHVNKDRVSTHPQLPVAVLNSPGIEEVLFQKQVIISSFNYPLASSEKVNRIVLNALHTKQDISLLCKALCS